MFKQRRRARHLLVAYCAHVGVLVLVVEVDAPLAPRLVHLQANPASEPAVENVDGRILRASFLHPDLRPGAVLLMNAQLRLEGEALQAVAACDRRFHAMHAVQVKV